MKNKIQVLTSYIIIMRLDIWFVTLLTTTTSVFALTMQENITEDGFYLAYYNDTGHEVHERISAPNNLNFTDGIAKPQALLHPQAIQKRATGMSFCGCGYYMNHVDCDAANQDLTNQVAAVGGLVLRQRSCYYSIRGSAVAFVCNPYYEESDNTFRASNVGGSDAVITSDCGWYVAGTYAWGYWAANLVGYMNYSPGLDFLGNAMGANALSC